MNRLPTVTSTKLIRALHKIGFQRDRQRGSHIYFSHPDGRATVVPSRKSEDIGRGLLRKILRDIKMESQDLAKLL